MELVLRSKHNNKSVECSITADDGGVWIAILSEGEQIDFSIEIDDWEILKKVIDQKIKDELKELDS